MKYKGYTIERMDVAELKKKILKALKKSRDLQSAYWWISQCMLTEPMYRDRWRVPAKCDALAAMDADGIQAKMDALAATMQNADAINRTVRANKAYAAFKAEADKYRKASDEATAKIERLEHDREKMIASAKFPIRGLSLTLEGVAFEGKPFSQASSAEQLRVSVAMAIAMNPKLRVCLIRDGSLLDDESLAMVAEIGEEHDFQIWIERVGHGEECAVIIEDGYAKDNV